MKTDVSNADTPRFHNRLYRAEVGHTTAGSPVLKIIAMNPTGRFAQHRQIAAHIYDLAAQLERRSDEIGARWVISPAPMEGRITIELVGDHERARADELVADIIAEHGLAGEERMR